MFCEHILGKTAYFFIPLAKMLLSSALPRTQWHNPFHQKVKGNVFQAQENWMDDLKLCRGKIPTRPEADLFCSGNICSVFILIAFSYKCCTALFQMFLWCKKRIPNWSVLHHRTEYTILARGASLHFPTFAGRKINIF